MYARNALYSYVYTFDYFLEHYNTTNYSIYMALNLDKSNHSALTNSNPSESLVTEVTTKTTAYIGTGRCSVSQKVGYSNDTVWVILHLRHTVREVPSLRVWVVLHPRRTGRVEPYIKTMGGFTPMTYW